MVIPCFTKQFVKKALRRVKVQLHEILVLLVCSDQSEMTYTIGKTTLKGYSSGLSEQKCWCTEDLAYDTILERSSLIPKPTGMLIFLTAT